MERWIVIGVVFVLIAQAIGLIAYYSQRKQFSKSAQNVITILPAVVFALLAVAGAGLYILLAWWAEVQGLRSLLLGGWFVFGLYVFGGTVANLFLSIVVQLMVLMIHPPTYKTRRRRRHRKSSSAPVPDETSSAGS
jgi:hypothetical protein